MAEVSVKHLRFVGQVVTKVTFFLLSFLFGAFCLMYSMFWLMLIVFFYGWYIIHVLSFDGKLRHYFLLIIGILLIAITTRMLIFDIYTVPSSSMENEIYPGDKLLVNKLSYGPKLPQSPFSIPILNLFADIAFPNYIAKDTVLWQYKRLKGWSVVKRNDVIVFKRDYHSRINIVKRCIGLPGEVISIKRGVVYINGKIVQERSTVKKRKVVHLFNAKQFIAYADQSNIKYELIFTGMESATAQCDLDESQWQQLLRISGVEFISDAPNEFTRPSIHNMSEMIIPKRGLSIILDEKKLSIYKEYILDENNRLFLHDPLILNLHRLSTYTFKKDYYFMMGDNRDNSIDSRHWGFVSADLIEGRVYKIFK